MLLLWAVCLCVEQLMVAVGVLQHTAGQKLSYTQGGYGNMGRLCSYMTWSLWGDTKGSSDLDIVLSTRDDMRR